MGLTSGLHCQVILLIRLGSMLFKDELTNTGQRRIFYQSEPSVTSQRPNHLGCRRVRGCASRDPVCPAWRLHPTRCLGQAWWGL